MQKRIREDDPRSGSGDQWLKVCEKINLGLQAAQPTINFDAMRRFGTENTYDTYTPAYRRSGGKGNQAQLLGDAHPPGYRAQIDDWITFNNATGAATSGIPHRGLMPGRQGMDCVREQMEFRPKPNQPVVVPNPADPARTQKFADSSDPRFNADTKQVFAALNYRRRLHGSNTTCGSSHMVLDPKFKVNALYFPGDAFYIPDASRQSAFHVLGSLVAWAKASLLEAIIQVCCFGAMLPDTSDA